MKRFSDGVSVFLPFPKPGNREICHKEIPSLPFNRNQKGNEKR